MKVAILLHGEPRFCAEFDLFLKNLTGYDQVDWFMYLWKNNNSTANLMSSQGHRVVAPCWQTINKEWALDRFKQYLPINHNVVSLELADQTSVPVVTVESNKCETVIFNNVWKMWYSQYMANKLKIAHEQENNFKYDLVIKIRPDVALLNQIDLKHMKQYFDKESNLVLMSHNKRCGYGVSISDTNAITTSDNMNIYADIYNQALDHHARGCIFHPETMLAKHLEYNGLVYAPSDFGVDFRSLGFWTDINTGETWKSSNVPTWHNKYYTSDFGRWS
jgi:ribosomal protein S18 acetylase RimI-like enzyme